MLYHVLAPLDCSLSHSAHHLVRTEFSQFSTTSPAACLCSNYLLYVTVSTYLVADFFPPLLKRYLCIAYWQILRIKFVTFSGQIYSTKFESVSDYETLQKTSASPRTARELSHVKWLGIIKIYIYFLKKYFLSLNQNEWFIFRHHWLVSLC